MEITYKVNASVSVEQFIALMRSSSLGDRRP
ncbi:MAG: GNAT family N-acetyltransferase, partial [Gammaproteobacteria bacterium]